MGLVKVLKVEANPNDEILDEPIDPSADGIAAAGFYPQNASNDMLAGVERDATGNLVLKDSVVGSKTLNQFLQLSPSSQQTGSINISGVLTAASVVTSGIDMPSAGTLVVGGSAMRTLTAKGADSANGATPLVVDTVNVYTTADLFSVRTNGVEKASIDATGLLSLSAVDALSAGALTLGGSVATSVVIGSAGNTTTNRGSLVVGAVADATSGITLQNSNFLTLRASYWNGSVATDFNCNINAQPTGSATGKFSFQIGGGEKFSIQDTGSVVANNNVYAGGTGATANVYCTNVDALTGQLFVGTASTTGQLTLGRTTALTVLKGSSINVDGPLGFSSGTNRTIQIFANSADTAGNSLTIQSGTGGAASATGGGAGGSATYRAAQGGAGTAALPAGVGGALVLAGGNAGANNGGAGASGGSVSIDGGTASGSGTGGSVSIGTGSATSSVTIGKSSATTTLAGSSLTIQTGIIFSQGFSATINPQTRTTAGTAGNTLAVSGGNGANGSGATAGGAGATLTMTAGSGGNGTSSAAAGGGAVLYLYGGNAGSNAGGGGAPGGGVDIQGGTGTGGSNNGAITIGTTSTTVQTTVGRTGANTFIAASMLTLNAGTISLTGTTASFTASGTRTIQIDKMTGGLAGTQLTVTSGIGSNSSGGAGGTGGLLNLKAANGGDGTASFAPGAGGDVYLLAGDSGVAAGGGNGAGGNVFIDAGLSSSGTVNGYVQIGGSTNTRYVQVGRSGAQTIMNGYVSYQLQTPTFSTTIAIDATKGCVVRLTLTASLGSWTLPGAAEGTQLVLMFVQDATGNRLIGTPPSNIIWLPSTYFGTTHSTVPVLTTTANKRDCFWLTYVNGVWIETLRQMNF